MQTEAEQAARILVLEDDATLREVLLEVLEARGLEVTVVASGEEALKKAREHPFDLIVADIRMKGISGLDTIEQAREFQPDMASIVVSGYASEQETLRAVKLNVAGYLKKPFKIPELLDLISDQLRRRRVRLKTEEEIRTLRRGLLWALRVHTDLAEKVFPGEIKGPAQLARGLAGTKGLSGELADQVFSGTALKATFSRTKVNVAPTVLSSLKAFPTLLSALKGDELSNFSLSLGGGEVPTPEALPPDTPDMLRRLYERYLLHQADSPENPAPKAENGTTTRESSALLSVAANLEQLGDFKGAYQALDEYVETAESEDVAVRGHLRKGRIAARRGDTEILEHEVKKALEKASTLGPHLLSSIQWESADLLDQAKHPAAGKLFLRAAASLDKVGQTVPWSCCILAVAGRDESLEKPLVNKALKILADGEHISEVTELVERILPHLLNLARQREDKPALELLERFAKGFPLEFGSILGDESVSVENRLLALDLIKNSGLGLSEQVLHSLRRTHEPKLLGALEDLKNVQKTEGLLVRVYSFGGLTVNVGDRPVTEKEWRTQKTKFLFARLLEYRPASLNVDQIAEDFWPNKETSRNSLNTSVSTLRKVFQNAVGSGSEAILRVGETLALSPELRIWSDETLLNQALKQAAEWWGAGEFEKALSAYGRVIRLYRGPYLEGCYLEWALVRRSYFERQVELGLTRLMEHRFKQHRYLESQEYAQKLLQFQPDDTRSHEVIMLSQIGLDRHQKAIQHFEEYSASLRNRDGSEPPMELMKVHQMAKYGFQQTTGLSGI